MILAFLGFSQNMQPQQQPAPTAIHDVSATSTLIRANPQAPVVAKKSPARRPAAAAEIPDVKVQPVAILQATATRNTSPALVPADPEPTSTLPSFSPQEAQAQEQKESTYALANSPECMTATAAVNGYGNMDQYAPTPQFGIQLAQRMTAYRRALEREDSSCKGDPLPAEPLTCHYNQPTNEIVCDSSPCSAVNQYGECVK